MSVEYSLKILAREEKATTQKKKKKENHCNQTRQRRNDSNPEVAASSVMPNSKCRFPAFFLQLLL